MSASTDRLIANLQIRLPGALVPAIQQELFNAVNEFCQDSNVWRNDISVPIVANTTTYYIAPDDDGQINRLIFVHSGNGLPINATMAEPGVLVLNNTPSEATTYTAQVALTVTDPTDNNNLPFLPDWIYDKYWADFQDGVLSLMMSQMNKPYANPQMAVYHGRRWRGAISAAKIEAQRKNLFGAQAWAFPQMGARMTRPRR